MRILAIIQSIVWPSVFAVVFAIAAVAVAFLIPGALAESLTLAGAGITFATLATRA